MSDGQELRLGPASLYRAKGLVVHARSFKWALLDRRRRPPAPGVRILLYHRVTDEADRLAVTPRRFREQIEYLAARGYRMVDVAGAARAAAAGETARVVGLSFDDGYRDVVENAAAVLERHGAMATVYVVPDVIDGAARFTWYQRQPPLLGWDEIATLDGASPFRFEAHTRTHPNLLAVDDERARWEIEGSREIVAQRLGREVESFCYPAGLFGERELRLVEAAGYRHAVTCEPGANGPGTDPLALHRTVVESHDRLIDLRAKLAGAHDSPLPMRALYRRLRYGPAGASVGSG